MKTLKLIIVLLTVAFAAQAQQDPQFTHYSFMPEYINPGAAGMNKNPFVRGLYRNQWLGYESDFDGKGGAPISQVLTGAMPLLAIDGGGALNVVNDVSGRSRYTSIQLSLSKHVKLKGGRLGLGLQGSYSGLALRSGVWRTPDTPAEIDPTIPNEGTPAQMVADMGAGAWYQAKDDRWYAGLSMSRLLDAEYEFTQAADGGSKKHMYLTGGYKFDVDVDLSITPTMLYKTDFGKADKGTGSFEVGAKGEYQEMYWGGLNFRQGGDLGVLIGASFLENNELKVGYALDLVLANTVAKKGTSHEIMIGYYFPEMVKMAKPIIRTPRYKF